MSTPLKSSITSSPSKQLQQSTLDDDTSHISDPLPSDSTLSSINNDDVTSTPDTELDDPNENREDPTIKPTQPQLLKDGRFDVFTTNPMKVIKKILVSGEGPMPGYEYECKVLYRGKLPDGTVFDEKMDKHSPFQFTIGQHTVIKGWEIAVQTMCKHEKAEFTIASELAYGKDGSPPKIPPNSTLFFEIELLSFHKEPITHEEKIENSTQLKDKGARYVKKGNWEMAFRTYRDAQVDINDLYHRKLDMRDSLRALKIALHLNVALCSLKLQPPQLRRAVHESSWVLLLDPHNPKAYYRRGLAEARLHDSEAAVADLTQAARLQPGDALIRQELAAAQREVRQKEEKERRMYGGLFQRMQELESTERKQQQAADQQRLRNDPRVLAAQARQKAREEQQRRKEEKRAQKHIDITALTAEKQRLEEEQARQSTVQHLQDGASITQPSPPPPSAENTSKEDIATNLNGFQPLHTRMQPNFHPDAQRLRAEAFEQREKERKRLEREKLQLYSSEEATETSDFYFECDSSSDSSGS